MLKELYMLPFIYNDNNNKIQEIKNKYYSKDENYKNYFEYF